MWKYNDVTWTCKHGHRWDLDGNAVQSPPERIEHEPPALKAVVRRLPAKSQPYVIAAVSGALAAVVVDVLVLIAF